MMMIDSHCHIHDSEFFGEVQEQAYRDSRDAGVSMICVGTDLRSSRQAIAFCAQHEGCWPIVGIHPHEAKDNDAADIRQLVADNRDTIVGIGEIGLDYYYAHSSRDVQQHCLREQLAIAVECGLPVSFHIRDSADQGEKGVVWRDFWPIFDEFAGVRGVLHSFTDTQEQCDAGLRRGLYVGVNGISTFTKDAEQQQLFASLPLDTIVLETDAPYLTPVPFRGKMNVPAYVGRVAEHQAGLKRIPVDDVARITSANAQELFGVILYEQRTTRPISNN